LSKPRSGAPPCDEPKTFRGLVDFREVKNNSSGMIAADRRDDEKAMRLRIRDGCSEPLRVRLDHSPSAFSA
jgi:hypothetical protein